MINIVRLVGWIAFISSISHVSCRIVETTVTLSPENPLAFVAKFSYAVGSSDFELLTTNRESSDRLSVYLLMDEEWLQYENSPCEDRVEAARVTRNLPQSSFSTSAEVNQFVRPHVWYVMIGSCSIENPATVSTRITFLNPGRNQFSFEEFRFPIIYLLLSIVSFAGSISLLYLIAKKKKFVHPTSRIAVLSLCIFAMGILAEFIHLSLYQRDGVGSPDFFSMASSICRGVAQYAISVMFTAAALSSFQTSHGPSSNTVAALAIIFAFIIYVILIVLGRSYDGAAFNNHEFDTVTAKGIIVLQLIMFGVFFSGMYKIVNQEFSTSAVTAEELADGIKSVNVSQRQFVIIFCFLGASWFLCFPGVILIAEVLFPLYYQHYLITIGHLCVQLVVLGGVSWLFVFKSAHVKYLHALSDSALAMANRSGKMWV